MYMYAHGPLMGPGLIYLQFDCHKCRCSFIAVSQSITPQLLPTEVQIGFLFIRVMVDPESATMAAAVLLSNYNMLGIES